VLGGGGFGFVRAVVEDGEKAVYVPIEPTRVLDTRSGTPVSNSSLKLDVEGTITPVDGTTRVVVPEDASAVAVNITVTEGRKRDGYGYVTAYPCVDSTDAPPNASSLNFENAVDIANGLNVTTSYDGSICLYVWGTADLIVDVVGYYEDHNHDDRYPTLSFFDSVLSNLRVDSYERPSPMVSLSSVEDYVTGYHLDAGIALSGRGALVDRIVPLSGGAGTLRYRWCANHSCLNYGESLLTDLPGDPMHPSLEFNESGHPIIAYYDNAVPYGLRLAECLDEYCIDVAPPLQLTTGVDTGQEPEIANLIDGGMLIAYRDGTGATSTLRTKRVICPTWESCSFQNDGQSEPGGGHDPTIVMSPNGNPFIVHFKVDGANSKGYITRCSSPACTSKDSTSELSGPLGGDAVLTSDGGLLVMGYRGSTIYAWRCLVQTCAPAGPNTYASDTEVLASTVDELALDIGDDGYPVGVYSDSLGSDSRVVYFKCVSTDCFVSGGSAYELLWNTQPQGSTFDPRGDYLDIVVSANGMPLIFDQGTEFGDGQRNLSAISCANPYCLPYVRMP